ncbi:MAG: phage integrase N-terminal SAM-like domain-containing protein, partial [Spirochaetia bacterium]
SGTTHNSGYRKRTCYTYYTNFKQYLEHYNLPADQLDNEQVKDYLYYLLSVRQSSAIKERTRIMDSSAPLRRDS